MSHHKLLIAHQSRVSLNSFITKGEDVNKSIIDSVNKLVDKFNLEM